MKFIVTKIATCLGTLFVFFICFKTANTYSQMDVNEKACYTFVCISITAVLFALSSFIACASMIGLARVLRRIVAGQLSQNTISLVCSYFGIIIAVLCYVLSFLVMAFWKQTAWRDQMEEPCPISWKMAPTVFTLLSIVLSVAIVMAIGTMVYMGSTRRLAKKSIKKKMTPRVPEVWENVICTITALTVKR